MSDTLRIEASTSEAKLSAIEIVESGLSEFSPARRMELEVYAKEMLMPGECVFVEGASELHVLGSREAYALKLAPGGEEVSVLKEDLRKLMTEYIDTVRAIAKARQIEKLETLDMAKKVTHDKAGRLLERRCRALGVDHPTARRLFSLLLTLRHDTTRLVGVHGHRIIR